MSREGWIAWGLAACLSLGVGTSGAASLQVTVVDEQGRPVPDAVVFLDSVQASKVVRPMAQVDMAQQNKRFVPDVLLVTRGTPVAFPNRDTVRHHVYSFSPTKRFELKLYVGTPAQPVVFDQPGVAVLGCNIHDQMIARVVVVDTPYRAQADADGRVVLDNVPPDAYQLRLWHQRLPVGASAQAQALSMTDKSVAMRVVLRKLEAP
ncbi:methylamine utilization protein [Aquabacterium sp.]|uniref:methylamine utilization protein n=1 Tax=Aquabacterium sp. TaxID=1872578 RepID=UPI0035B13D07